MTLMTIASTVKSFMGNKGGQGGGGGGNIMPTDGSAKAGAASMIVGGVQLATGLMKRKQAKDQIPGREDPEFNQLITNLQRRIRAFETGTANASARKDILAGVTGPVAFSSGRATMTGLNQMNTGANKAILALNNQAIQAELALSQLYSGLVTKKVQRKLDIDMLHHLETKAIAENRIKAGGENLAAGYGQIAGAEDSTGGMKTNASSGGVDYSQFTKDMEIDPNQAGPPPILSDADLGQGPAVDMSNMEGVDTSALMTSF